MKCEVCEQETGATPYHIYRDDMLCNVSVIYMRKAERDQARALLRAVLHEVRSRLPESLVKEIEEELGG